MAPGINFLKRFSYLYKRLEETRKILDDVLKRVDTIEEHPLFKRRITVCELCAYEYKSPGCIGTPCTVRNYLESKEKENV